MAKKLAILILFIAFISIPGVARAQMMSATSASSSPSNERLFKTQAEDVKMMKQEAKQDFKDKMQSARDAFKTKISEIKDARKKITVENIDTKLSTANTRITTTMSNSIERLTQVVTNLSSKSAQFKTTGKDTRVLDEKIAAATTALTTAKAAVEAQKAKTYSATITSEATLRSTIGAMVQQFRTDILAVHKTVEDARMKVFEAMKEARTTDAPATATGSGKLGN